MGNSQKMNEHVLSKELIFLDVDTNSQEEIIQLVVDQAHTDGYISNKEAFNAAVKKREEEVSTAIGYSIAIPHGKSDSVNYPFIAFVRTANKMRWTEKNEELVQLIFLIGIPKESENNLHLKFISQLSKRLLDENFRSQLLNGANKPEILEKLNSIEI